MRTELFKNLCVTESECSSQSPKMIALGNIMNRLSVKNAVFLDVMTVTL
jgi:hypothetical protein